MSEKKSKGTRADKTWFNEAHPCAPKTYSLSKTTVEVKKVLGIHYINML